MNNTNNGMIINGGEVKIGSVSINSSHNEWDSIYKWVDKHSFSSNQYTELKELLGLLEIKSSTGSLSQVESKNIFSKIMEIVGSIVDANKFIEMLKSLLEG